MSEDISVFFEPQKDTRLRIQHPPPQTLVLEWLSRYAEIP